MTEFVGQESEYDGTAFAGASQHFDVEMYGSSHLNLAWGWLAADGELMLGGMTLAIDDIAFATKKMQHNL